MCYVCVVVLLVYCCCLICRTVIDVELLMATVNGNELVNFCTPADCSHVLHSGLVYFI